MDEMLSSSIHPTEEFAYSYEEAAEEEEDIDSSNSIRSSYNEGTVLHEKITTDLNEHIDKLLAELEFIEKPLVGKRIRKTKKQLEQKKEELARTNEMLKSQGKQVILTSQEKREQKKEQVRVLLQEFEKNKNWSKPFIKDLSKQIGLSVTQIYKWNWDQKKKEIATAPTTHTTPNSIDSAPVMRMKKTAAAKQVQEQVTEQDLEEEEDSYHMTFSSHRSDSQSLFELG